MRVVARAPACARPLRAPRRSALRGSLGSTRRNLALSRPIWHGRPVSSGEKRCWLDRSLAFLSAALPFGLSLARAASSGQWREDLTAVRDLGLVAVGVGGGLSTALSQALSLLPLGPRTFRTALGSALALALAS
ncbi:hypothetical protein BE15_32200, partial [Sorangium cellulosum]